MRTSIVAVLVAIGAFALPAQSAEPTPPAEPAPRWMLLNLMERTLQAWEAGDIARIARFYKQDSAALFFPIQASTAKGWVDYSGSLQELRRSFRSVKLSLTGEAWVVGRVDSAMGATTFHLEGVDTAGAAVSADFRWTVFWLREGSDWLIDHEHVSAMGAPVKLPFAEPTVLPGAALAPGEGGVARPAASSRNRSGPAVAEESPSIPSERRGILGSEVVAALGVLILGLLLAIARVRHTHGSLLHFFASRGSWKAVDALLRFGADPDRPDEGGRTPLMLAAEGDPQAVKVLLAAGADLMARDHDGETALHHAVRSGPYETISRLARRGADLMAVSKKGATPVDVARSVRRLDALELLVIQGADVTDEDRRLLQVRMPAVAGPVLEDVATGIRCPSCRQADAVYISRSRNWREELARLLTPGDYFSCQACSFRGLVTTPETVRAWVTLRKPAWMRDVLLACFLAAILAALLFTTPGSRFAPRREKKPEGLWPAPTGPAPHRHSVNRPPP